MGTRLGGVARKRVIGSLIVWLLALAGAARADVWVADEQHLYKIDPGAGKTVSSIDARGSSAIVVDPDTSDVWVLAGKTLSRRSPDGSVAYQVNLGPSGIEDDAQLALDDRDGSVWIGSARASGDGRVLLHLDRNGVRLGAVPVPDDLRGFALALDASLWVLGQKQLLHYARDGALLASVDLKPVIQGEPKLVLVDSIGAWIWLAAERRLARVDATALPAQPISIVLAQDARALAVDPAGRAIWVLGEKQLSRLDTAGNALGSVNLSALGVKDPRTLAFDAVSRSLLVGHEAGVTRFDAAGAGAVLVQTAKAVDAIGVAPFVLDTAITLASPVPNSLSNRAADPVVLHMQALCAGVDCGFTKGFYQGYSIAAQLNGQSIGGAFTIDPDSGDARYQPPSRFAEGTNTLHAQATDRFGRTSGPLDASFRIDTTPPQFANVAPVTPYLTNKPALHVTGTLSEPATLVAGGGPVAVASDGSFAFDATLAEGLNAIGLQATDLAGNVAATSLAITLDTVPPSFVALAPGSGSLTNRNPMHITAKLSESGTLTIGGVSVTPAADGTFAYDQALVEGANSIVVVATDAAGNSTTRTLTATLDTVAPAMPDASKITLGDPAGGSVLVTGAAGAVEATSVVHIMDTASGAGAQALADASGAFSATIAAQPGDQLSIVAVDAAGNSSLPLLLAIPVSNNVAPTVTIDGIAEGDHYIENDTLFVSVAASDPDDNVATIELLDGDTLLDSEQGVAQITPLLGPLSLGPHAITARATDDRGATTSVVVHIQVDEDPADVQFRAIWNAMNASLVAGDKATAMSYLTATGKDIYGPVFDALMPDFASIVASYSELRRIALDPYDGIAIYAVNRTIDGVDRIFMVQFVVDENGTWLIDTM